MVQIITPKLREILDMPTVVDGVHQSVYRSNSILLYVLEMVKRGDSKESIYDVYYMLSAFESSGHEQVADTKDGNFEKEQ